MEHFQHKKREYTTNYDHDYSASAFEVPGALFYVFAVSVNNAYHKGDGKKEGKDPMAGTNVSHASLL